MCYYFRRYSLVNNFFDTSIIQFLSKVFSRQKRINKFRVKSQTFNNTVRKIIINKK
jgi:hypothetical protein